MTDGNNRSNSQSDNTHPSCEGRQPDKHEIMTATDNWFTPRDLAEDLGTFDLDPCAHPLAHVRARHYALENDTPHGLSLNWGDSGVFVNPPYSNPLPWCEKLAAHQGEWVALVKLDPTTRWWRVLMSAADWWAPFRKRLRFDSPDGPRATANFPSALVGRHWWPRERMPDYRTRLWPEVRHI